MTLTAVGIGMPDWIEDGLCAQADPEAYYPDKGGSTQEAKAICRTCPVRNECLQWALDNDERFGVWGGLSERERRKIKAGTAPMPTFEPVQAPGIPTMTPAASRPVIAAVPEKAPAMPTPPPTPAAPQPSYVDQIIAVMAATEGHTHPDVRAARKTVANALVALNKTLRTIGDDPTVTLAPTPKPAASGRSRGAGAQALKDRVAALGVTPRDVRTWAKANGHEVPMAGLVPGWAVDLYEQAHPQAAAS